MRVDMGQYARRFSDPGDQATRRFSMPGPFTPEYRLAYGYAVGTAWCAPIPSDHRETRPRVL